MKSGTGCGGYAGTASPPLASAAACMSGTLGMGLIIVRWGLCGCIRSLRPVGNDPAPSPHSYDRPSHRKADSQLASPGQKWGNAAVCRWPCVNAVMRVRGFHDREPNSRRGEQGATMRVKRIEARW